jgi:hypothetical protein
MKKNILLILLLLLILCVNGFCTEGQWQTAKSTHFIAYFKKVDEKFINELINKSEGYYTAITNDLGFSRFDFWLWDERAKIYIYDDVEEYKVNTGQPAWSAGCVSVKDKIIKTYPLASGFFDTLLPHELGHIVFRELVGFDNRNIPLWLDEGVASYEEMSRRFAAKRYLRRAIKENKFMPLDKLSDINLSLVQDKQIVDIFYAEAVSLVDYLVSKFGNISFVNFCKDLRDGKSLDAAISRTYPYANLRELNNAWVTLLKNE